jgi:hypothetical protein
MRLASSHCQKDQELATVGERLKGYAFEEAEYASAKVAAHAVDCVTGASLEVKAVACHISPRTARCVRVGAMDVPLARLCRQDARSRNLDPSHSLSHKAHFYGDGRRRETSKGLSVRKRSICCKNQTHKAANVSPCSGIGSHAYQQACNFLVRTDCQIARVRDDRGKERELTPKNVAPSRSSSFINIL